MKYDNVSPMLITTQEAIEVTGLSKQTMYVIFREIRKKYPKLRPTKGHINRKEFFEYMTGTYDTDEKGEEK